MDVKLVSPDQDLYRLCREALAVFPVHHRTISISAPEDCGTGSDLYLWDYQPGMPLPNDISSAPSKYVFLVGREFLAEFRKRAVGGEANILLKPVTRATLGAFLGFAVSAYEDRMSAAGSWRADRDEALQCLIQTNLKLQEYDQDRTTFLARAMHDFRAPLTALGGYCGLLTAESLGPLNGDQKAVLRRMEHSAKRLSRMAAGMFQLSLGRQIKSRPELQNGDLRECLAHALHEIAPLADDKHISITADLGAGDEALLFESGQIEQLLINLLDNACKFTPKAGSVEIRGYPYFWERRAVESPGALSLERRCRRSREPNAYRMDICNSGTPIAPENLEGIFEEYTPYTGGKDRSGGGLGLAICKMIITQHEGQIWAANAGSGPIISFVLPARPVTSDRTASNVKTNLFHMETI